MNAKAKDVASTVTAQVPPATTETAATPAPFVPKMKRQVTFRTVQLRPGMTTYIKPTAPMGAAKRAVGNSKEPASLLQCLQYTVGKDKMETTGEVGQIVVPAVLRGILNEEYEKDSYVGKCLAITKSAEKRGKTADREYYSYVVAEVEA